MTNVWEIERKRGENREVVKLLDQARAKISRERIGNSCLKEFSKSIENYSNYEFPFLQFEIPREPRIESDQIDETNPSKQFWRCRQLALPPYLSLLHSIQNKLRRNIFSYISYGMYIRTYTAESVQFFSESILFEFASTVHKEERDSYVVLR